MKKLLFLIPVFVLAGINDSYAFKKGFREGKMLKQIMFGKILSQEEINKKCLNIFNKYKNDKYIQENKNIFLKGCKEGLSSGF